jgi:hypothetical protein
MFSDKMLTVIHSSTLEKAINIDKEVVDTFLECSRMREIVMLATPTSARVTLVPDVFQITYEDLGQGYFTAGCRTPAFETNWGFKDYIQPAFITHLYGCREDSEEFKNARAEFLDLLAFEAISRARSGESIFVSQSAVLLDKNVWIQKRFDVKILSFVQALEYLDLYLKKQNIYHANSHTRQTNGKAFDYWFLLKYIVPKFAEAWSISVFGRIVINNGQEMQDVLAGLADKFQNALSSSDRIAMEYMKRPVNSTEWEMLYHFNYFCMLATGIFDSLAWLTVYRHSIPVYQPYQVSIRITGFKSRGAKFVSNISRCNLPLASFIASQQDFINLFYPMRDATHHREPVGGAQFEDGNEGWTASLATLKPDAVSAIKSVDQLSHPFTKWGLLNASESFALLEPYRFTRKALRELLAFTSTYIELLDFPSLIAPHQDLIDKIAVASSQEPEPPFIARVYWRRDSHLPILFRNRY